MLNFAIKISMRNSSNTTRNINKHGRSFPSNLCGGEYAYVDYATSSSEAIIIRRGEWDYLKQFFHVYVVPRAITTEKFY